MKRADQAALFFVTTVDCFATRLSLFPTSKIENFNLLLSRIQLPPSGNRLGADAPPGPFFPYCSFPNASPLLFLIFQFFSVDLRFPPSFLWTGRDLSNRPEFSGPKARVDRRHIFLSSQRFGTEHLFRVTPSLCQVHCLHDAFWKNFPAHTRLHHGEALDSPN